MPSQAPSPRGATTAAATAGDSQPQLQQPPEAAAPALPAATGGAAPTLTAFQVGCSMHVPWVVTAGGACHGVFASHHVSPPPEGASTRILHHDGWLGYTLQR